MSVKIIKVLIIVGLALNGICACPPHPNANKPTFIKLWKTDEKRTTGIKQPATAKSTYETEGLLEVYKKQEMILEEERHRLKILVYVMMGISFFSVFLVCFSFFKFRKIKKHIL